MIASMRLLKPFTALATLALLAAACGGGAALRTDTATQEAAPVETTPAETTEQRLVDEPVEEVAETTSTPEPTIAEEEPHTQEEETVKTSDKVEEPVVEEPVVTVPVETVEEVVETTVPEVPETTAPEVVETTTDTEPPIREHVADNRRKDLWRDPVDVPEDDPLVEGTLEFTDNLEHARLLAEANNRSQNGSDDFSDTAKTWAFRRWGVNYICFPPKGPAADVEFATPYWWDDWGCLPQIILAQETGRVANSVEFGLPATRISKRSVEWAETGVTEPLPPGGGWLD